MISRNSKRTYEVIPWQYAEDMLGVLVYYHEDSASEHRSDVVRLEPDQVSVINLEQKDAVA